MRDNKAKNKAKQGFRAIKNLEATEASRFFLVRGTGLEFGKKNFQQQITSNYVIFSSETIKHGTSQSSCFIRANAIKGTNKGKIIA